MRPWARGKHAFGYCDRCDMRFPLHELTYQYINRFKTTLLVCPDDLDIDHEQLRIDMVDHTDPQTLRDPRPDRGIAASRGLFGWNPTQGVHGTGLTNIVTVTTG